MVEFMVVKRGSRLFLDCLANFRKQEMRYWWPINVAELATLQRAVIAQMTSRPRPVPGRIVTVSAIALYGHALPRVAVLELDRAVEREADVWELAQAVVDPPASEMHPARVRWHHVLDELAGDAWSDPPIPKVGHRTLLELLDRALVLKPSTKARTARNRLSELCDIYDALAEAPPNPQRRTVIEDKLQRFDLAIRRALKAS